MKNIIGIILFLTIISALAILINGAANWLESQPSPPDQKFEIVDTYRGCSVVRYSPTNAARYSYFLDCTDEIIMGMPYGTSTIKARKEKYD
jgi:hypothetical protein